MSQEESASKTTDSKIKDQVLIPVNAKIIRSLDADTSSLVYLGVKLLEVYLVGHIIETKEEETVMRLKVWEPSGTTEVVFENKAALNGVPLQE